MALTAKLSGTVGISNPDTNETDFSKPVSSAFATVSKQSKQTQVIAESQTDQVLDFGSVASANFVYVTADKNFSITHFNGSDLTTDIAGIREFFMKGVVTAIKVDTGGAGTGDTTFEIIVAG